MPEQNTEALVLPIDTLPAISTKAGPPENAPADQPNTLQAPDAGKRKRLKKMRIGDALRVEGLDEREVAQKFRGVIERQIPKSEGQETNDKLLVDMLLSCFRYLDDGPRPAALGGSLRPTKLLHNVPRPRRTPNTKTRTGKDS